MNLQFKICMIFILSSAAVLSYPDGCFFSDKTVRTNEPNQKALITWDGVIETMLVISKVKEDSSSNFAWIIPVRSKVKPEVMEGDTSIFNQIHKFFPKRFYRNDTKGGGGEAQIIEIKEIGLYDIAVLKPDDSEELKEWLGKNGYKIPDEAEEVFKRYISSGDCYFIANKIDLNNKFEDDARKQKAMLDLKEGLGTPLKITFRTEKPVYPLEMSRLGVGNTDIDIFVASGAPLYDINQIMQVDETRKLNEPAIKKIIEDLKIKCKPECLCYVTRFIYDGKVKDLSCDAVFESIR